MRAFAVMCTVVLTTTACCAQPFSSLDVGTGATANVHSPDLGSWWSGGFGGDVGARMPFYQGVLETGVSVHQYTAREDDVPSFRSVFVFAGWGGRSARIGKYQAYAGGRIGIYMMAFGEDSSVRESSPHESEMAISPALALQRRFGGGWSGYVEMQHLVVLTAVRLHLTHLSVGVRRSFDAPSWLRSLLE